MDCFLLHWLYPCRDWCHPHADEASPHAEEASLNSDEPEAGSFIYIYFFLTCFLFSAVRTLPSQSVQKMYFFLDPMWIY